MTLKLILVGGLYPQVAIADEFNHLKVTIRILNFLHFKCFIILRNIFHDSYSHRVNSSIIPNRNHSLRSIQWDFLPTIHKCCNWLSPISWKKLARTNPNCRLVRVIKCFVICKSNDQRNPNTRFGGWCWSTFFSLLPNRSLLETTKPYLMNTLRMPAAQTLLLFAHAIETNATFSR